MSGRGPVVGVHEEGTRIEEIHIYERDALHTFTSSVFECTEDGTHQTYRHAPATRRRLSRVSC